MFSPQKRDQNPTNYRAWNRCAWTVMNNLTSPYSVMIDPNSNSTVCWIQWRHNIFTFGIVSSVAEDNTNLHTTIIIVAFRQSGAVASLAAWCEFASSIYNSLQPRPRFKWAVATFDIDIGKLLKVIAHITYWLDAGAVTYFFEGSLSCRALSTHLHNIPKWS